MTIGRRQETKTRNRRHSEIPHSPLPSNHVLILAFAWAMLQFAVVVAFVT